jgi:hypothetical protein
MTDQKHVATFVVHLLSGAILLTCNPRERLMETVKVKSTGAVQVPGKAHI